MSIRIALARKVKFNSIPAAERLYVDLLPETWSEGMPGSAARRGRGTGQARARCRTPAAPAAHQPPRPQKPRGDPRQGRDAADVYPLRLRHAGSGQRRSRERGRQAHARIRSADQMGSGGRQGGDAGDVAVDGDRGRRGFGRPSSSPSTAIRRCAPSARTAASSSTSDHGAPAKAAEQGAKPRPPRGPTSRSRAPPSPPPCRACAAGAAGQGCRIAPPPKPMPRPPRGCRTGIRRGRAAGNAPAPQAAAAAPASRRTG